MNTRRTGTHTGTALWAVAGAALAAVAPVSAQWIENFDGYPPGPLGDQGGWMGGDGALVTAAQAHSPPHALGIDAADNPIHPFSGHVSGVWELSAWQYVPVDASGGATYFILLSVFEPNNPLPAWATQLRIDPDAGVIVSEFDGATLPLVTGAWARLVIEIDLQNDQQTIHYEGQHLVTKSWSEGVSGGGALEIAALSLWANGAGYLTCYDDLSLMPAGDPCPADVNGDGTVDVLDLLAVLAAWGAPGGPEDINGDGVVDVQDLLQLLSAWGPCP